MRGLLQKGALILAMAVIGLMMGWAAFGEDLVWRAARPDHAALLADMEIPTEPSNELIAADAGYLLDELQRRIPYFRRTVSTEAVLAEAEAMRASGALRGETGLASLMRLASLPSAAGVGMGHTNVPLFQRPLHRGVYPFLTYLFDDGLWIVRGAGGAGELVGQEITAIGGLPIAEVLDSVRPYIAADNPSGWRDELPAHLSHAVLLQGLGLTNNDAALPLSVRTRQGEQRNVEIKPVQLVSLAGLRWAGAIQTPVDDAASPADPRPRKHSYSLEYRPHDRLLYVDLNRIRNEDRESLVEFAERIVTVARQEDVDRVILDLRANGGGNNQLVDAFVDRLAGDSVIDRRGVLYTLIGRGTYSAAGALAAALERRTRTLFAGERTGFTPNHHGDAEAFLLPGTGVIVNASSRYWADGGPHDARKWIEPDLPVAFESRHHFGGEDAVVRAVLEHTPEPRTPADFSADQRSTVGGQLVGRYRFSPHMVLEIERSQNPGSTDAVGVFRIRGVDLWAASAIYPIDLEATRFETDIAGVFLQRNPTTGHLSVDWHGEVAPLPQVPQDFRLPIERVRAGVEDPAELEAGIADFRRLAEEGAILGSRWEFALNGVGYALLNKGRNDDALQVFELQAELFPTVANVFDSLGDARLASGDTAGAQMAFQQAVEIDSGFAHSRRMLNELGGGG